MTDREVRLATQLYEMRDRARRFHGADWPAKWRDWQRFIELVCAERHLDTLQGAMVLAQADTCPPLFVAEIMGAAVEMIEAEAA